MPSNRCSKTGCRTSLSKRSITRPKRSGCLLRRFRPWASYSPLNTSTHAGSLPTIAHPEAGTFQYPGAPYRFSATPWAIRRPAPGLGQHNSEVYGRLEISQTEIDELQETRGDLSKGEKGKGKRGNGNEKTNDSFSLFTPICPFTPFAQT